MTVLQSINNADGSLCVDVFRRDDGSIGFEEYRRDPEDPAGGWYPVGGYAGQTYGSVDDALSAATTNVVWFKGV